jgi:hypothetical protein
MAAKRRSNFARWEGGVVLRAELAHEERFVQAATDFQGPGQALVVVLIGMQADAVDGVGIRALQHLAELLG